MTVDSRSPYAMDAARVDALRAAVERGDFPGIDFRTAMRFALSGRDVVDKAA